MNQRPHAVPRHKLPEVRLVEVGPRDGLQNEPSAIPLAAKVAFIDALSDSGLPEIEAGAFVSPKAVPQMADSGEVFEEIRRQSGVRYSALVPNEAGLERALEAEADKVAVFTAVSETFNQRNINATVLESLERFRPVIARAKKCALPLRAYISTAFHCPYEGPVRPEATVSLAHRLLDMGADELSVGDTIGRASPNDVRSLLDLILKRVPVRMIFLHLHDTYGMAVANAMTAFQEYGVSGFDSSTGGIGGCPYAPGAGGNVATEDLAFALRSCGARVPADLARLRAAGETILPHLGHPLMSRLSRVDVSEGTPP